MRKAWFTVYSTALTSVLLSASSMSYAAEPAGVQPGVTLIAQTASASESLREEQRELFKKAEYAARRGRHAEYQQLIAQLDGYPLLPYLELIRLKQVGYLANEDRVLAFLDEYEGTPLDWQLRQPWLDYLARSNEGERFIRDYRPPGSVEDQCQALRFQRQHGDLPETAYFRAIDKLWQTGVSLPKACDPLLAEWSKAGNRTQELVWQRIKLAAEGGNHTLLPYLGTLLPAEQGYLAELYQRMRQDPSQVTRLQLFPKRDASQQAEIAAYAYGRLIWRDPDLALRHWQAASERFDFTTAQQGELAQTFALALSNKDHPEAGVWQERVPPTEATEQVLQWRLAGCLRQQNFTDLLKLIEQLPAVVMQGNQWRYWHARAAEETGDVLTAQRLYEDLADERHYYGFQAAAKLQQRPDLENSPVVEDKERLAELRQRPEVLRAYEFLQLDRSLPARREWNYLMTQLKPSDQQLAAVIASEWGWHDQAIAGLAAIGHFDAVQLRFPFAYYDLLADGAERAGIDDTWALAITRRESAFREDAYSSAGARGLMQILPSTAKFVNKAEVSIGRLHNPVVNTRLGTQYLGDLQRRLRGNQILATASYNAGIYRVKEWLPDEPVPADIWIETIPYKETRDYVKNVLAYQQIYIMLLNQDRNLFNELVDMKIGRLEDDE